MNSITLLPGEVHLWKSRLSTLEHMHTTLLETLSKSERIRLNRFRFNREKEEFIVGRGILRTLIGRYLHRAPKSLSFCYTTFGKPYLEGLELNFNISHSGDYILYAFSKDSEIGVDVEHCRTDIDFLSVFEEFCSAVEYEKILKMPSKKQCLAFYQCLTRKEAIVKAIGEGISFPLKQLEVGFLPSDRIVGPVRADSWCLTEIDLGADYIANLATEKSEPKILLLEVKDNVNNGEN